jgi:glycosyltransferase involved in cell wall biosynthesis
MRTQRIAAAMMLKNESQRILVTLKSLEGTIKGLIVFDTGSTDNTLEILGQWCTSQNVQLHVTKGEFVDFSRSRNVLFDFADTIEGYDFLLLLDCNDELQGGDVLLNECEKYAKGPEKVFMVRQRWLTGTYVNKYLNARLVKTKHGWRYKKRVHEYLAPLVGDTNINRPPLSEDVVLFQNRNDDDDKTQQRFKRDKEFLLADVASENDPRDMFYLAQTLSCLGEYDESYNWYQKRGEIIEGFWEERFHSYLRSAEIAITKKNDTDLAIANFFKAAMIDFRAEPLIALGKIYRDKQDFVLAYSFLAAACELEFPVNNILFVSENDYSYERWQQLSIVCFYVGRYTLGKRALAIARATGRDADAHKQNQDYYDKADSEGKKDSVGFPPQDMPTEIKDIHDGFIAEGRSALNTNDTDTAITKFLQAFQLSHRLNSLLLLTEYCRLVKAFKMAWCVSTLSCQLDLPSDLQKKEIEYSYLRWHIAGIVGFYSDNFAQGKEACMKAIKGGQNISLDRKNLVYYIETEASNRASSSHSVQSQLYPVKQDGVAQSAPQQSAPQQSAHRQSAPVEESLQKYKDRRVQEMMAVNPKMPFRQADAKAQLEWKLAKKR